VDVAAAKQALREQVRGAVAAMPPNRRFLEDEAITAGIQQEDAWRRARRILLYRSTPREVSTVGLANAAWREGKLVAFPRVAPGVLEVVPCSGWDDLVPGLFGMHEPRAALAPVPSSWVELALVPGVAFSRDGHRLGRGGGHYDRFLPTLSCPAWGLGFEAQLVDGIPTAGHDVRLARIITAKTYLH
jgi:5-formyltetrahydrofolate cyclo-ligase